MATAFFNLLITESKQKIGVNLFKKGSSLSYSVRTAGGSYGSNLARAKIVGLSEITSNSKGPSLLISFELSAKDEFYEELTTKPLVKSEWDIEFEMSNQVVSKISSEKVECYFYSNKKDFTAALSDILGKEGIKAHKLSGDGIQLIQKVGLYEKVKDSDEKVCLRDFETVKKHKLYNPEMDKMPDFSEALSVALSVY